MVCLCNNSGCTSKPSCCVFSAVTVQDLSAVFVYRIWRDLPMTICLTDLLNAGGFAVESESASEYRLLSLDLKLWSVAPPQCVIHHDCMLPGISVLDILLYLLLKNCFSFSHWCHREEELLESFSSWTCDTSSEGKQWQCLSCHLVKDRQIINVAILKHELNANQLPLQSWLL